jgi:hypothetical protein
MKFIMILIVLLSIKSCSDATVNPENEKFGEEFSVEYQKAVDVSEELLVTFSSFEESRCPEGVQCVRAGEFFATLQLENKKTETEVSATFCIAGECLTRNTSPQRIIYFSGDEIKVGDAAYTVDIQDFSPKNSTQSSQESSYQLSLLVKK